jgi:diadenosine tetraphosphate (Ap4A) HIT family hydrolase
MTEAALEIDERLRADTHELLECRGVLVLVHRNATLPWFILVPLPSVEPWRELFQLPADLRATLLDMSDRLSRYLLEERGVDKINLGALGNLVPQFHWHLVGRYRGDPCWPGPVWGNLHTCENWADQDLRQLRDRVAAILG